MELGTLFLDNDKNDVIKLFFVFKLSGLNSYLKGYLKPRTNKLPKKNKINK